MPRKQSRSGLYLLLISVHGLIRGSDLELGRDSDTGGQTLYVVELLKALAAHPQVDRVDLLTRQVMAKNVDPSYAKPVEQVAENAYIFRMPCGPRRYLRKERLWPYMDSFSDQTLAHIRQVGRIPDIIHAHYADAGYVGSQLARLLGVPFVFTGHSLGRVKRARLLEKGASKDTLERKFTFRQRIEAEETSLDTAVLVVASTHQEIDEQYALYDYYEPARMSVIPPGVDLSRFSPPRAGDPDPAIAEDLARFLKDPDRPMILAIARPDERKNFPTLITAFGESTRLRERANLVLIAGNRDDLTALPPNQRRVFRVMMTLIDRYDLWGSVALPKHHEPDDVPDLYRLAVKTKGVFVNPAFTEPFGLTLVEAAASGLPIVATNDGGPRDIIRTCKNGFLIDPLDSKRMAKTIERVITNVNQWPKWSRNGIEKSHRYYSWSSHVNKYLRAIKSVTRGTHVRVEPGDVRRSRLPTLDRILISSIDDTLTGNAEGLRKFLTRLRRAGNHVGFGVATGRAPESAVEVLRNLGVPIPDILISSAGTEIYYGRGLIPDRTWHHHINYHWKHEAVRKAMKMLRGCRLQDESEQREFKVSYVVTRKRAPSKREIVRHLRQRGLRVNVVYSHGAYIDILPIRASMGLAVRYLSFKWGVPPERMLIAGYSGIDEEMLSGNTLGVVVGGHSPELKSLEGKPRIYFARKQYARGLLEGVRHYDFFGKIRIPGEYE